MELLRRRWIWGVGAAVLAVGIFGLVWFQPHKLFVDDKVDEAVPTARVEDSPTTTSDAAARETTTTVPGPVDLAGGSFVSIDHGTSGDLRVLELADGRRFVRFEGFETSNGPDVFVYLTANPADGPEGAFDDDYVDLGRLQGNIGDQNYEIPADVDWSAYASVVVWCDRFDSAFGAADIQEPSG